MGVAREPAPVKVVVAILAAGEEHLAAACDAIEEGLGAIEMRGAPEPWEWSSYYAAEMGGGLCRQFVALAALADSESLAALKETTNRLEARWRDVGRRVNLDPGYVDVDKLVLASTKPAAHRIHLRRGIHAECALRYEDGRFAPWSYTYPDYRTPGALEFFTRVRRRLKQQRRAAPGADPRAR